MGACLNHSALFSHQTHFLSRYEPHNSYICVLEMFKDRDSWTKHHLPSSALPPLHILLPFWLPVHSSLFFFFFQGLFFSVCSRSFVMCLASKHHHVSPYPMHILLSPSLPVSSTTVVLNLWTENPPSPPKKKTIGKHGYLYYCS